jgi:hypothetical protein
LIDQPCVPEVRQFAMGETAAQPHSLAKCGLLGGREKRPVPSCCWAR